MDRSTAVRLPLAIATLTALACGDATGPPSQVPSDPTVSVNGSLTGLQVFPIDNWWNLRVDAAPLDPASDELIDWLCDRSGPGEPCDTNAHPDFGPPPYGIPYLVVDDNQPLTPVTFVLYGDESDEGAPGADPGYPIPDDARTQPNWIEGAVPGGGTEGDRHLLIVNPGSGLLFETWATRWNSAEGRWEAGSGAVFDLTRNDRRPEGWTSADAAGLAVLAGLVRYDETQAEGEIEHALRFTARATDGHVWPASHTAGSTDGAPPMGTRLRLKADVDIDHHPPAVQKIFRALKRYGLILADNGSDLFIQGTMDERWDNGVLNPAFHGLSADDFEVIELGWRP